MKIWHITFTYNLWNVRLASRLVISVSFTISKPDEIVQHTLLYSMRWLIKGFSLSKEEAYTTALLIGIRKEARSQVLHLSRNKRYTLTPEQLKWDKFKLTYKYSFAFFIF